MVFLMPSVLLILGLSLFPLLASLYMSLSRFRLAAGGFSIEFTGLSNYRKLLFGSEAPHLLGSPAPLSAWEWAALVALTALLVLAFWRYVRSGATIGGAIGRVAASAIVLAALYLMLGVFWGGSSGTLPTTMLYVFVGVAVQYLIGLGLALLCMQNLPGRRLFRALFFLPLMITPVGIAYVTRMLADTQIGPLAPIWMAVGLAETAWSVDPAAARFVVMLGDAWQWIPFIFIVLSAALESQDKDIEEAARIDGASAWQIFRYVTLPAILPVSITIVVIRIIEAFKIIDLPNVLTNGGPGYATESLALHAYIAWRTLDLGGSAAVSYITLAAVMVSCLLLLLMTSSFRGTGK